MELERYEEVLRNWAPENEEEMRDQRRYIALVMNVDELNRKELLSDEVYQRMYDEVSSNRDQIQIEQFVNSHISTSEYDEKMNIFEREMKEINEKYGFDQEKLGKEFSEEASMVRENLRNLQAYYRNNNLNIMMNVDVDGLSDEQAIEMYNNITADIASERLVEMIEQGREVIRSEAIIRRRSLKELQAYYRVHGNDVLNNVAIDLLNDKEAIERYNEVVSTINPLDLSYVLAQGREIIDGGLRNLKDELSEKHRKPNPSASTGTDGGTSVDSESEKNKIEKEIENFVNGVDKVKEKFNDCQFKLVLEEVNLEFNDIIRGLSEEVSELHNQAENLIREMDEFKEATKQSDFSMSPSEIRKTIKDLKTRLKTLKQIQIDKYNARAQYVNELISELKGMYPNDEEVNDLMLLDLCDVKVSEWRNFKYLDKIDYNKLIEVSNKVTSIRSKYDNVPSNNTPVDVGSSDDTDNGIEEVSDLEADMLWIEKEIKNIDSKIMDVMPKDMFNQLSTDVSLVADRINGLRVKLENERDSLTDDQYNNYIDRLNDAEANLADLNSRLKDIVTNTNENMYDKFSQQLENVSRDVSNLSNMINSLCGHVLVSSVSVFEDKISSYEEKLSEIKEEIEQNYKDGNLLENQYDELIKKIVKIEKELAQARQKVMDPEMVKDGDIFALLNGQISGLEESVSKLEEDISKLEAPIKDKATRKKIADTIKRLEEEAKNIENYLEANKDKDPEKYNAAMERLNAVKERLDKVSKKYREKCPLLVRGVKSAKEFYKKHKKICLIVAGLAAIALVHATVGPVIIPAIMHGNIMIGSFAPNLAGFTGFVNNVLGGLINARNANGLWYLANGVRINNGLAGASLLKGIAISGIGSTTLVAPVIVAIKKLIEKMKNVELKNKLSEKFDKEKKDNIKNKLLEEKEKLKAKVKKEKNNGKELKKTQKMVMDMFYDKYMNLLNEFHNSGMSYEEFCVQKELNEDDRTILNYLEESSKKAVNKSKGGRK